MYEINEEKSKMTPQRIMEILKKHGTVVTLEEAEEILVFVRRLAKIAMDHALRAEAGQ